MDKEEKSKKESRQEDVGIGGRWRPELMMSFWELAGGEHC